MGDGAASNV